MPGSSGAIINTNVVMKCGEGTHIQGTWLKHNPSLALPRVLEVGKNVYFMERLEHYGSVMPSPEGVRAALEDHVWTDTVIAEGTPHNSLRYGKRLAADWWAGATTWLEELYSRVHWGHEEQHRVHGDPTLSNLMRRGDQLVIIDPIPPRNDIPSYRGIDLGKMLQSALGFEVVRYGQVKPHGWEFGRHTDWIYPYERAGAYYFALLHFLRLMPYMPDDDMRGRMKDAARPLLCV